MTIIKVVTLILLSFTLIIQNNDQRYISYVVEKKSKINIAFNDSTVLTFKVNQTPKKNFQFNDTTCVYLDVDTLAKPKLKIDSILCVHTFPPETYYNCGVSALYLVFIIDKDGKILHKGVNGQPICPGSEEYNRSFYEAMTHIKLDFLPAKVKGNNVASLRRMVLSYIRSENKYKLLFEK